MADGRIAKRRGATATTSTGPSARERVLEAASTLFYRKGIRGVGVDTIIERAGVAKATFYSHFPSKDDLVLAWLQRRDTRWFEWAIEETERRARSPEERLVVFFDVLGRWFEGKGFRGCPFINTAAETLDPKHPARREFRQNTLEIEGYLRQNCVEAGLADPDQLAGELFLLMGGAIVTAVARGSSEPAAAARAAAETLVATARRQPPPAGRS